MFTTIPKDIHIYNIFNKLSPLNLYNLRQTNKLFFDMIDINIMKQSIIQQINERLFLIFGDKLNVFKQLMSDTKSVISGSFIIQCILNENWHSDIDIFFPTINNVESKCEGGNPAYAIENFLYYDMKLQWNDGEDPNSYKDEVDKTLINFVRSYQLLKPKNIIQVIQVNIDNNYVRQKQYIHDTFDFDICKNIYFIDDKRDNLSILKLTNILNKIGEFNVSKTTGSSIKRYHKYINRGFNLRVDTMTRDKIKEIYLGERGQNYYEVEDLDGYTTKNGLLYVGDFNKVHIIRKCPDECLIKLCNSVCDSDIKHIHCTNMESKTIYVEL
jgi:hypothetical protein